jgi:hypothetical protein
MTLYITLVTCSFLYCTLQKCITFKNPITQLKWSCYLVTLIGKLLVARGSGSCIRFRSAAVWARIERASSSNDWKVHKWALVKQSIYNFDECCQKYKYCTLTLGTLHVCLYHWRQNTGYSNLQFWDVRKINYRWPLNVQTLVEIRPVFKYFL